MTTKKAFAPYDTADYLESIEDVSALLEAVIEGSGDPAELTNALGVIARSRHMGELARRTGLSRELTEGGDLSFVTVSRVAAALGFRLRLLPG